MRELIEFRHQIATAVTAFALTAMDAAFRTFPDHFCARERLRASWKEAPMTDPEAEIRAIIQAGLDAINNAATATKDALIATGDKRIAATKVESSDLTTELGNAYIDALHRSGLAHNTWEYLPEAQRSEIRHGMQFALAHLAAAGRLVPEGGMPLTAEQVEDLREVLAADVTLKSPVYRAWRRVSALFLATEPTETPCTHPGQWCPCEDKWHAAQAKAAEEAAAEPAEERCSTCNDEGDVHGFDGEWRGICHRPAGDHLRAPAVPAEEETTSLPDNVTANYVVRAAFNRRDKAAEEETKADESSLAMVLEGVLECGDDGWVLPYDWSPMDLAEAIVHAPASSPVVPAPAETGPRYCPACKLNVPNAPYCTKCVGDTLSGTGPWMHADEIPNDVTVVIDRDKRTWKYSSRTDKWTHRSHGETCWVYGYPDPCFAPFVAAEEGQAR